MNRDGGDAPFVHDDYRFRAAVPRQTRGLPRGMTTAGIPVEVSTHTLLKHDVVLTREVLAPGAKALLEQLHGTEACRTLGATNDAAIWRHCGNVLFLTVPKLTLLLGHSDSGGHNGLATRLGLLHRETPDGMTLLERECDVVDGLDVGDDGVPKAVRVSVKHRDTEDIYEVYVRVNSKLVTVLARAFVRAVLGLEPTDGRVMLSKSFLETHNAEVEGVVRGQRASMKMTHLHCVVVLLPWYVFNRRRVQSNFLHLFCTCGERTDAFGACAPPGAVSVDEREHGARCYGRRVTTGEEDQNVAVRLNEIQTDGSPLDVNLTTGPLVMRCWTGGARAAGSTFAIFDRTLGSNGRYQSGYAGPVQMQGRALAALWRYDQAKQKKSFVACVHKGGAVVVDVVADVALARAAQARGRGSVDLFPLVEQIAAHAISYSANDDGVLSVGASGDMVATFLHLMHGVRANAERHGDHHVAAAVSHVAGTVMRMTKCHLELVARLTMMRRTELVRKNWLALVVADLERAQEDPFQVLTRLRDVFAGDVREAAGCEMSLANAEHIDFDSLIARRLLYPPPHAHIPIALPAPWSSVACGIANVMIAHASGGANGARGRAERLAAADACKSHNVLLTGAADTGKSTVLRIFEQARSLRLVTSRMNLAFCESSGAFDKLLMSGVNAYARFVIVDEVPANCLNTPLFKQLADGSSVMEFRVAGGNYSRLDPGRFVIVASNEPYASFYAPGGEPPRRGRARRRGAGNAFDDEEEMEAERVRVAGAFAEVVERAENAGFYPDRNEFTVNRPAARDGVEVFNERARVSRANAADNAGIPLGSPVVARFSPFETFHANSEAQRVPRLRGQPFPAEVVLAEALRLAFGVSTLEDARRLVEEYGVEQERPNVALLVDSDVAYAIREGVGVPAIGVNLGNRSARRNGARAPRPADAEADADVDADAVDLIEEALNEAIDQGMVDFAQGFAQNVRLDGEVANDGAGDAPARVDAGALHVARAVGAEVGALRDAAVAFEVAQGERILDNDRESVEQRLMAAFGFASRPAAAAPSARHSPGEPPR